MLTTDEALAFLRAHQPMPEDQGLDEDLIRRFEEIRRHFVEHPDPRCVMLFLGALPSSGSGFGVYQLLDDVLEAQDRDVVVSSLRHVLADPRAARTWAMDFALGYPDPALADLAEGLVDDDDEDLRCFARTYLEHLGPRPRPTD